MEYYINNHHHCCILMQWSAYESYQEKQLGRSRDSIIQKQENNLVEYLNRTSLRDKAIYIGERTNATSIRISERLYNRLKKEVPTQFFTRWNLRS